MNFVWQIVDSNKGGVVAEVEGLKGFVPFSQISTVSSLPILTFMDLRASDQLELSLNISCIITNIYSRETVLRSFKYVALSL